MDQGPQISGNIEWDHTNMHSLLRIDIRNQRVFGHNGFVYMVLTPSLQTRVYSVDRLNFLPRRRSLWTTHKLGLAGLAHKLCQYTTSHYPGEGLSFSSLHKYFL